MPPKRPRFTHLPWRSRAHIARDIDTEVRFHLEMRALELTQQGIDPTEAERRAREEFGDIERTRAYCRDEDERTERVTRAVDWLSGWVQDARYAVRTLRRSPGFTVVSLLTLALAIGANTAIFSVARSVLLRPLPYGSPNSLVALFTRWPQHPDQRLQMSPPDYVDYKAQQRSFSDIGAAFYQGNATWRPEHGEPSTLINVGVTPNLFRVLHVDALHGTTFPPDADRTGSAPVVIISYRLWQRALGGDTAVVGGRMMLDDKPYALLGVMPSGFTLGSNEDIWTPLDLSDDLAHPERTRKQHWLHPFGRIRAGVTLDAARADLRSISRVLSARYPEADSGWVTDAMPMHDLMVGDLRTPLLLLQAAAAMVLLIACANLANLTLARAVGRRQEMALRAALGAGRGRLVRHVLTESVLLGVLGGAVGVALAAVSTRTLLALNPDALPPMFGAAIDTRVLLFSACLSMLSGVVFGLVPAIDSARPQLHDPLKEGGGGRGTAGGRTGERARHTLIVVQVGLAVMLLVGAGLLIRSFGAITRVQLGFDPDHVLTAQLTTTGARYDAHPARNAFFDALLADLARSPGVVAAGAALTLPTRGTLGTTIRVEGQPVDEARLPDFRYVAIRGDYFKALQIPLIAGRLYSASDLPDGPKTAIINQTAARRFFPAGGALGHRFRIGPDPHGAWMTVVGIVGDVHDEGLDVPANPTLFANHRQEAWDRSMAIVIRTRGDPITAVPLLRRAVSSGDPTLALSDIRPLDDVIGQGLAPRRFALGLATSFAALALLLAAIGIYGVLAYAVTSRTRELGVRLALGATARSILALVARQGLGAALAGLALGMAGAMAGSRLLARALYGVGPLDLWTYLAVSAGLLVVVVAACIVPAARATRVDPLTSMRAE